MTDRTLPSPQRGLRTAVWAPCLAFSFALLCATAPILLHSYLPLVDLPNHIARHHIAAYGQGALTDYYTYAPSLVPNSAADLVWRFLGHPGDPVLFSSYLMAFYAASFIAATMFLSRILHGGWSVWPAGVALVVFNAPFFWGFQNFVLSVPFCLLALALWLALEDRGSTLRIAVFIPVALGLYLMHFFAFAILCIAAFGREVQRLLAADTPHRYRFARLTLAMLPFALPIIWLVFTILTEPPSPAGTRTEFGSLIGRWVAFISPFTSWSTHGMPQINQTGSMGFWLFMLCLATFLLRRGPRLSLHPKMRGPAIALMVAMAIAPTWLNGVALVHIRIPLVLVAVLFAATRWRDLEAKQAFVLAAAFATVIGLRSHYMERFVSLHDAEMRDMLQATQSLPAGARLVAARSPGLQRDYRLSHVQAYTVVRNNAFVPTLFQGVHALQLKQQWADYAHPALFAADIRRMLHPDTHPFIPGTEFLENWEHKFTHLLLLDPDVLSIQADPRLTVVAQVGRFTLYSITPGS